MQFLLLIYLFVSFSVGLACLSLAIVAARRDGDALARAFLVFYVFLTLTVISALLRTFIDMLSYPVAPTTRFVIEYFESFVGRYGVMFSLPMFVHRVFASVDLRRDYLIGAIVGVAAAIQHVTEFWLTKAWDDRGDFFEDVLFVGIVLYTLWFCFTNFSKPKVYRPLALRLFTLGCLWLPGIAYDLFLSEDTGLKFYPLGYSVVSVVVTWSLIQRRSSSWTGSIEPQWGLSEREAEVAGLVLRGNSNKKIAEQLHISRNTVKTHLRAIFDKSGVRSRFELISASRRGPSENGP